MTQRATFVIRLEAPPGAAGIHALRAILKTLLRRFGFVCLEAREVVEAEG